MQQQQGQSGGQAGEQEQKQQREGEYQVWILRYLCSCN
jgi:hypothetical protein